MKACGNPEDYALADACRVRQQNMPNSLDIFQNSPQVGSGKYPQSFQLPEVYSAIYPKSLGYLGVFIKSIIEDIHLTLP